MVAPIRTGMQMHEAAAGRDATIKLLDLLTNRYHLGRVCGGCGESIEIELPRSSRLHAGQRVRFVVANDRGLVAREEMRSAVVMHVEGAGQRISLALLGESAAA